MPDNLFSEGVLVLPKRVSLIVLGSMLAFLLAQTCGFVWAASKMDSRVESLEQADRRIMDRGDERFIGLRTRIEVLERDRDRLTRVEEKIGFIRDTLQEVIVKLDRKASGRP